MGRGRGPRRRWLPDCCLSFLHIQIPSFGAAASDVR